LISHVCSGVTMNSRRKGSVNQRGWPGGAQVEMGSHSIPFFTPSMRLRMRSSYSGVSFAVGGPPSGVSGSKANPATGARV